MQGSEETDRGCQSLNPRGFHSFTVNLMTHSLAQNDRLIVNNELEWIRQETIVILFEMQTQNLSEGTDKRCQDSPSPGRDFNPETRGRSSTRSSQSVV
jgi:hypothetical protein